MKRSEMMRCRHRSRVYPRSALGCAQVGQARLAWIVTVRGGPGSAVHRSTSLRAAPHLGHGKASDAFVALFTFQTAHLVPAARFCARGFASLLHSPRIEGWAERRETFGCSAEHPWGTPSCVKDARERAYDAACRRLRGALRPIARQDARERAYDAGRSPLGAPPWRFWASGPRLRLLRRPPSYNRRQLPSDPRSELLAARS
jgi:hypothetical protein